ncbi:hypothetical protein SNE40_007389 [Patella caerulea]|uniref:Charged multivesicular body protein 7 n=1 Tax=Patella caerulea TaxID=87958 RepID=A0AAN8PXF4_PATCE
MSSDDSFPPEWQDDQRMTVLFAAFRDKSLNPHSWNKKMNFWMNLITDRCKKNNSCVVSLDDLPTQFERKGKTPKCLDLVVQEMTRLKRLRNISDIEASSAGWLSWGYNVMKKPVSWSLSLLGGSKAKTEKLFYIPDLLQDKCKKLLRRHYDTVEYESTDNLIELSKLKDKYHDLFTQDFDVVLRQLEVDKKIIIAQTSDNDTLVKFCKQSDKSVETIQDSDLNVYRILKVQKDLEKQVEILSEKCDRYTEEARLLVKQGKKTKAIHSLRKKRAIEKSIDQKTNSLDILHTMTLKIQEAANNEMVIKAYESGVSALKAAGKDIDINKVDNVMDNIQELLGDQEEINQTLSRGEVTMGDTTMADLESELENMLLEDKPITEIDDSISSTTADLTLPSVPRFSPTGYAAASSSSIVPGS